MATDHATKGLEHRLETEGTIKDREHALPERVIEPANTVAAARLGRPHEDDRRGRIDSAEQLKDPALGAFLMDVTSKDGLMTYAMQQNECYDIFTDDFAALADEDSTIGGGGAAKSSVKMS